MALVLLLTFKDQRLGGTVPAKDIVIQAYTCIISHARVRVTL
jgi:hypothetical protein